ncbi:MAG TPA: ribosome biogenesis GTPase Der [Terriglobia bacterium]|nr:ribosome biogenesis GTPase Der [Terriglobia bacterium]
MTNLPRIVILGRPNVGKSTLFNRICGRRRALVGDQPGMTRDRIYAPAEWMGKRFEVVDTGGMVPADKAEIPAEIFRQARVAIEEATHLVLVVDGREGVVPLDEELAAMLRRTGRPLALAVNKADTAQHEPLTADFYGLGIRDVFPVSAEHGLGVDELLDHLTAGFEVAPESSGSVEDRAASADAASVQSSIVPAGRDQSSISSQDAGPAVAAAQSPGAVLQSKIQNPKSKIEELSIINVAIIGRPNVGKSTLLNCLLNEERSIVTPVPGTTRDAIDAEVERDGHRFRFIDTAGIRCKGKTTLMAEKLSVMQARRHLERADVALLILDATEGVNALDTHIGGYAHESRRSVVIVVNKWDAIKKGPTAIADFAETIRRRMKYLDYAPIEFISAQKGQRVGKLVATIVRVAAARSYRVPTAEMNRFLKHLDLERAPGPGATPLRIYYLTQAGSAPPTFVAFTNRSGKLHFSVERYLENRIREQFGFFGTPIVIKSRASR